eukprot:CAMPEP_0198653900 /NCGR_PEP_ID=MMETSP1467-20131203/7351_1 /TAXON_ID=1462469 /ORGANISM="unid. sp., Strain CCMP2135" /LENGTH=932 /DNA_ID=CAMNT_0044389877 /DNA_START=243 /DNA_END=3041 /DNA_ORIENTATION=+
MTESIETTKLLNNVCLFLEDSLGLADRTLAEFMVDLIGKHETKSSFASALADHDALISDNLCSHIFDLVKRKTSIEVVLAQRRRDEKGLTRSMNSPPVDVHMDVSASPTGISTNRDDRERQHMSSSGVIESGTEMDCKSASSDSELDENVEIVLNLDEPLFLQDKELLRQPSIPVARDPSGSLERAAAAQQSLVRERLELQTSEATMLIEGIPKDFHRPWEDPTPNGSYRHFADELRSLNLKECSPAIVSEPEAIRPKGCAVLARTTSLIERRRALPIYELRHELMRAFSLHQVLVVIGETGSGKTTQMTQYLAELGLASHGIIGCTQPRRVAAMSIARRVAEEFGCELGGEVGYTIRFEDCSSPKTVIKYMTDGMLLREYLADKELRRYSAVILDEAHERTVHTDILFTLSKSLACHRSDLKLVVTSATLDAEKCSSYFFNCPIFTIPGRLYPVEIFYTNSPEPDYLDAALLTVLQIHLSEPVGDILVFLTGQEEIDLCIKWLFARLASLGQSAPPLVVLPVYAALPTELQSRIFKPAPTGSRKCIVATNIAEASLTIDGIFYVVDPGFCKVKAYNPKLAMDSLVVTPISQASARQRAGRAGRTGPGKCYRLYTESAFQLEMSPVSIPDIQRANLGNVVLQLKAMGIHDVVTFDLMDRPPVVNLTRALYSLYALDALDNEGFLTLLGRKMAAFPLEPQLSKALISASLHFSCGQDVATISAMLTIEHPFHRPIDKQSQADAKRATFFHVEGDHLTFLAVFESWRQARFSTPWCYENFIQVRSLARALDVRNQMLCIMERFALSINSPDDQSSQVRKAFVAGFFTNSAKQDTRDPSAYRTLSEGLSVQIHPSSALIHRRPEWLVYHELVLTRRAYMHHVTTIKPRWLAQLAPRFYKLSEVRYQSELPLRQKIEPLHDRFNAPGAWRLSKRRG